MAEAVVGGALARPKGLGNLRPQMFTLRSTRSMAGSIEGQVNQKLSQTCAELGEVWHERDRNAVQALEILVDVPRRLLSVVDRLNSCLNK
jgi:hypothetical protein